MRAFIQRCARLVLLLGIVWVVFVIGAWYMQDQLIFPRWVANERMATDTPASFESWSIPLKDGGTVEAWFRPAAGDHAQSPAIVLTHGNASLIDDFDRFAGHLSRRGYHVLLPEFRGYGRSGGSPSEVAIVQDTCRFVDRLKERPDVDADRICFIGISIGCGVATQVALQHTPAAMVLWIPPARVDMMAWSYAVPHFLIESAFRSDLAVQKIDAPILIIQREDDEVTPAWHAETLHAAAPSSHLLVTPGSHNQPDRPDVEDEAMQDFLATHLLALPPVDAAGTQAP